MKITRFLGLVVFLVPCVCFGAGGGDFQNAAKLLSAARRGDTQTVQILINNGADVNYVDATGMSPVCTAVMNNDKRAIQILQMYGADASGCDRQIKQYKQKTRIAAKGEEYGFFSGLSSTHVLALSAVGVAAVLGGVVLLANAFDNDNNNGASGANSGRPNGGGGGGTTTDIKKLFDVNLPNGPCSGNACPTLESFENDDFAYMSNYTEYEPIFNYLMVARAYNAFARGYMGMATVRTSTDKSPFPLNTLPYNETPAGGKPVNVAMITGSGVNPTGSAVKGTITWFDDTDNASSKILNTCKANGSTSSECLDALAKAIKESNKYYNITNTGENTAFDLSNGGTVFNMATDSDTKLAKIIAGWEYGGRESGDFVGFIPNGQLTVYKTGAGKSWIDTTAEEVTGSYTMADSTGLAVGDTLTLVGGTTITIDSVSGTDNNFTFVAKDSSDNIYNGYLLGYLSSEETGTLYVASNHDGNVNQMYALDTGDLTLIKETAVSDLKNYNAILNALKLKDSSGNYITNVVANLSLPSSSGALDYKTVDYAKTLSGITGNTTTGVFRSLINEYYNLNTSDDSASNTPAYYANSAFEDLVTNKQAILINSAGHSLWGDGDGESLVAQDATFENFAPFVYDGLQNLFMTVVAVEPGGDNGTKNISINNYSPENVGKLELSKWIDPNNTETTYISRMCGLAGSGNGGEMNPWCFAAPGVTDLEATASMAGSIALVKSAFDYMNPQQIFLLLALTADGPYLGTDPSTGKDWASTDALIEYLDKMYTLPGNLPSSKSYYLESFKTAFGYGMINLERATRPGTNVYYYDSDANAIISSSGKSSYWRSAITPNMSSHASNVLALNNRQSVKASFFDIIESSDGSISLPRVWNIAITSNDYSQHGLYMGDVLADFGVDSSNKHTNQIGNMTFDMAMSPRAYYDNLNGLDNLRVAFSNEKYDVDAQYQRFLTDGESRFNGLANGVLSLAADTLSTGAKYKYGKFAFGTRAFSGTITDENLLETDPTISSQFEPGRLGFANGVSVNTGYNGDRFGLNVSFGNMNETNTVLGMYSDGLLSLNGGNTQYVDAVATYKPFEKTKLTARATFADTNANLGDGIISHISSIKSNAFAAGLDIGGFEFTASMPLAIVDGQMGYDYADFEVVENNGKYEIAMNNPHVEYIDLVPQKRELRFATSYKQSIGAFTDAGVGFIYRVNPNNIDTFGNESIFMFKIHHRMGI